MDHEQAFTESESKTQSTDILTGRVPCDFGLGKYHTCKNNDPRYKGDHLHDKFIKDRRKARSNGNNNIASKSSNRYDKANGGNKYTHI